MSTNQPRKPVGTPVGGQWVPGQHDEADIDLSPGPHGYLGDVTNVQVGSRTPWGTADWVTHTAPGAVQVSTPGHGGIKLSKERNRTIPPALRNSSGWYEEDIEAGIVAWYHPDACPQKGQSPEEVSESGKSTVMRWMPDQYEAATGEVIPPGVSYMKDERTWLREHADKEIAVSASRLADRQGYLAVTVRRGGPGGSGPERVVAVPEEEYETKRRPASGYRFPTFFIEDGKDYEDITPPPEPPPPPRERYREVVTDGLTGNQRALVQKDLATKWRQRDGSTRALEEIIESGAICGKWADENVMNDGNVRRTYYLSAAPEAEGEPSSGSSYALQVSKATWDAIQAPAH